MPFILCAVNWTPLKEKPSAFCLLVGETHLFIHEDFSVQDEASQEKLDAWARYLQEVQKYKSANCMDDDNSRPLVKWVNTDDQFKPRNAF